MKKILLISIIIISILLGVYYIYFYKNNNTNIKNIAKVNSILDSKKISTVILPHHDLVKDKRDQLLDKVAQNIQPQTIILLSPNHFDTGDSNVITTNKTWQLSNSTIEPNNQIIEELFDNNLAKNQQSAFINEHGIFNILQPIKNHFPISNIVPIIFKETVTDDQITKLSKNIFQSCQGQCLVVASVDFSHYQPAALAEIHDSLSIRALSNLNENLIWRSEVDSQSSLAFAVNWAKLSQTNKFHLEENTNSGKLNNNRDGETTSYVFGWFEEGYKNAINNEITFIIGGDMMFDRLIDATFSGNSLVNIMENLGNRVFWGTDISLVNLEGPISPKAIEPDARPNNLVFNFPPKTVNVLKWLNINSVSLANNHSSNAGSSGLEHTKLVLYKNDIIAIGQEKKLDIDSNYRYGYSDAIVNIIGINLLSCDDDITPMIQKEKEQGSYVIIFPHWGNEYQTTHSSSQEKLAQAWIDAGADLVIGSHPHVVQDAQMYQGKPIFYSLGNLLFDQTFSKETQQGLIVAGYIKDQKLSKLVLLPTIQKDLKPELLTGDEKTQIISNFRSQLNLENSNQGYGYDIIDLDK